MKFRLDQIAIAVLVGLSSQLAVAQHVDIGILGGIRTTDDVTGNLTPESKRYIIGPKVEVRLPLRLSFEFDALYRRVGFTSYDFNTLGSFTTRERDNSWEFPMIVKYRLPVPLAKPFVGVGYAPRIVHGTEVSFGSFVSAINATPPFETITFFSNQRAETDYHATHGVVVSGGVNLDVGHLRFSPEARYVHWNAPFLNESASGGIRFVSNQDEVFVLLGISWH